MEDEPRFDDKMRTMPWAMTDREMLEEMTLNSRKVSDMVEGFFGDLKSGKINPMSLIMGAMKK